MTIKKLHSFTSQIINILKTLPKTDLTIIMGDFNAKVGKIGEGNFIGHFGLGVRNKTGETLVLEYKFVITSTFFLQEGCIRGNHREIHLEISPEIK